MALINHAKKEINTKIVYYGPPACGKKTALTYIYSRIKPSLRGDLRSVPAGADNLLFFDFSPFETPLPNGYRVRLHVYTLTGNVTNPATWKMILKGADGIMIMINPAVDHKAGNRASVSQLRDFLSAYGVGLHETPTVLSINDFSKEDTPAEVTGIAAALDLADQTTCRSDAAGGEGLLEALSKLSRQVLDRISVHNDRHEAVSAPPDHRAEAEAAEPDRHETIENTPGRPHADDSPQIVLTSREVVSEGRTIRIPLDITLGDTQRRLIVTVNVDLE